MLFIYYTLTSVCLEPNFLLTLLARYLRKEKELVEARFELLQSETTRLRQQNANLKRQVEATVKALAEEQENSQV